MPQARRGFDFTIASGEQPNQDLSRSNMCRQRAAEAKRSAARAQHPSIKRAFEEVASGWLILAEQTEWIERQSSHLHDEEASN
jgi:hypothetical protein